MAVSEQTKSEPRPPLKGQKYLTDLHVFLYKLSQGRLLGRLVGNPVLLLETIGRKSGQKRIIPLIYMMDDNRIVLIASNGGTEKHPAWWLNLKANPEAIVQIRGRRLAVTAREADPGERQRLWSLFSLKYPGYNDYQKRTPREIPVVILTI